jgi:2-phospho-L-lactate guanylyltransferase
MSMLDDTWAIVAIRSFAGGKSRLASELSVSQRRTLTMTMLDDVLLALARSDNVQQVAICTKDREISDLATSRGVHAWMDMANDDYSSSTARAALRARAAGAQRILILPADVPSVAPGEIERFVSVVSAPGQVAIAASRDGEGTNGLVLSPPDAIPMLFGPMSCAAHRVAGLIRGHRIDVVNLPGLSLDIDYPKDLRELAANDRESKSRALVRREFFPENMISQGQE